MARADDGADNGIGMVMNNNYLYASFSTSATIATFAVETGQRKSAITKLKWTAVDLERKRIVMRLPPGLLDPPPQNPDESNL